MAELSEELAFFEANRREPEFERYLDRPIAYFCAEFCLESVRQRIWSGGLGILAGDILREAGDRQLPMVAVGLYYNEGFVCETREVGGQEREVCTLVEPAEAGLEPVRDAEGSRIYVDVPIHDRTVKCRLWKVKDSPVDTYLLDSDSERNDPQDRRITHRLYVGDKETRLKQEMILGIGGMRALKALGISPGMFHLNEGHSALLALEIIHDEMVRRHLGFDEAIQYARRRIVMTNHTIVPAGHEIFSYDLTAMLLNRYALELSIPVSRLVDLGLVQESTEFSLSMLAFRTASVINAVSRIHAAEAKKIWRNHPMAAITNGIHVPTWDRIGVPKPGPGEMWPAHRENKRRLLERVREQTGKDWSEEPLLIGWARRIVSYKRPLAACFDPGRLMAMARNAERPFRLVFAGYPHMSDEEGKGLLRQIREMADGEMSDFVAYLPQYDLDTAKLLVSGTDVWLNTPVVGFEACGTSGMKAALNGSLPLSTGDGWVAEADLSGRGWLLDDAKVSDDIYDRLEQDILPLYYDRNAEGRPELWEEQMRRSRQMVLHSFTATRMLRKYLQMLYL